MTNPLPRYDLAVTRDGTSFGLMLAKNPKTQKFLYEDIRLPVLNPNVSPESARYAAFEPDKDWPIAQSTWHAGFGNLLQNMAQANMYGESVGWDGRTEGQLKLFGAETAVTVTMKDLVTASFSNMGFETWSDVTTLGTWVKSASQLITTREATTIDTGTYSCNMSYIDAPAITDSGFETWTDATTLTNWTLDAGTIARDNSTVNAGTYSCMLNINTAAEIHQDLTWDTALQGQTITWTQYLYAAAASTARIGIDDGVTTTWSDYNDGDSDWDQASVAKALSASATRLRLIVQRANNPSGANVDGPSTIAVTPVSTLMYNDLASWLVCYNNKSATFTIRAKTALASNLRIGIAYDGTTTPSSWSDYHTGGGIFETLTVTSTPSTTATGIRLIVQRNSTTDATTDFVDTATFAQAASRGNPIQNAFLRQGTAEYYLENKSLYKWSGTAYVEHFTVEDAIVDAIVYKNRILISVGTGDFYYYSGSSDDTTWTRSAVTQHKIGLDKIVGATLWGAVADAKMASCTDITANPGWQTGNSIGDSSIAITGLEEYNQTMYVGKQDNVYIMTIAADLTYTSQPIAPRFKGIASANNFKQMKVGDSLMLGHDKGMHAYTYTDYGDMENISPVRYAPAFTDYHGATKAIAVDEDWTYVVLEPTGSNTKSKVMAVRRQYIENSRKPTDWRWHSLAEVDQDEVYAADVHSNKLWIAGTKSGTASIKSYALDGTVYPDCTAAGVKVEFQGDAETTWTEIVSAGNGSLTTSGVKVFQDNISYKRFRFRFTAGAATFVTDYIDGRMPGELKSLVTFGLEGTTLNATGVTQTPIIKTFIVRCLLRTVALRTIWCVVRVYDDIVTKDGMDGVPASTLKTNIDNIAGETDKILLYDIHGNSFACHLKPPTPREYDVEIHEFPEKDSRVETLVEMVFQERRTS